MLRDAVEQSRSLGYHHVTTMIAFGGERKAAKPNRDKGIFLTSERGPMERV
jgi:hypothetical protein